MNFTRLVSAETVEFFIVAVENHFPVPSRGIKLIIFK